MKLCECGCGEIVKPGRRFIRGHSLRVYNKDPKFRAYLSRLQKERFKDPKNHPCYGRHLKEETKLKISRAKRSKKLAENPDFVLIYPNFKDKRTLAYLLGALLGDGSVQRYRNKKQRKYDYQIRLKSKDKEFAEDVSSALSKIGLHPQIIKLNLSEVNKNWNDCWKVLARSKAFYFWYTNLDLEEFLSEPELELLFLKGFFEAEGNFSHGVYLDKRRGKNYHKYSLEITNTNEFIMDLVFRILIRHGFHPYRRTSKNKTTTINYEVYLCRRREIKRFLEAINPCIPRKKWRKIG